DFKLQARALRTPTLSTYSNLKRKISRSSEEWILEFLKGNGLGVLLETLGKLTEKQSPRFVDAFLQLECVACVREVMNSQSGLDYIIDNPDFTRKFTSAFDNNNATVKKQIFDLLSALCSYSKSGYGRALEALDHYKELKHTRYRFKFLVDELKDAETIEYQATLLAFINCIIVYADKLEDRVRIRNDFIGLKILEIINKLRKLDQTDPDLTTQLDVFDQYQNNDEEELGHQGLDLNSPLDVFYAVHKQVSDGPQEISFLSILRHLLQVDSADPLSDVIWDTTEKLVLCATLL
ncbi:hypothetical protein CAPTEDRAFT_33095, partial [Capitella teleta]